jgi:hypothetical protein
MGMENFIKLYPHQLTVHRHQEEEFHGLLSFSVEQYGLLVDNFNFKLHLMPPGEHYEHWQFTCEDPGQLNVPNFVLFLKSIEHYIFVNLKFSPEHAVLEDVKPKRHFFSSKPQEPTPFHLYFENLFFDMNSYKLKIRED